MTEKAARALAQKQAFGKDVRFLYRRGNDYWVSGSPPNGSAEFVTTYSPGGYWQNGKLIPYPGYKEPDPATVCWDY